MAQEKQTILRIVVSGFGEASKDLEFLTDQHAKLTAEKKRLNTESRKVAETITSEKGSMEHLRAETALLRIEENKLGEITDKSGQKRKELSARIVDNTAKIRDHDRAISGSSTLVGEYEKGFSAAFGKIGGAITSVGGVIAVAYGAFKTFSEVINSTEGSADKLEAAMEGAKVATQKFFQMIITGDLKNFYENLEKAAKAGKEYAEALDRIMERKLGLTLEQAQQEYAQTQLLTEARSNDNDAATRQKALNDWKKTANILAGEGLAIADKAVADKEKELAGIGIQAIKLKELYETYNSNIETITRAEEKVTKLKELQATLDAAKRTESGPERLRMDLAGSQKAYDDFYATLTAEEIYYADLLKNHNLTKTSDIIGYIELLKAQAKEKDSIAEIDKSSVRVQNSINTVTKTELKDQQAITKEKQQQLAMDEGKLHSVFEVGDKNRFGKTGASGITLPSFGSKVILPNELAKMDVEAQKEKIENNKKGLEWDEKDLKNKQLKLAAISGIQMAEDAVFAAKKSRLQAEMEAELTNTNLTEAQKTAIKKKYAKQQQANDIKQAVINGAIGITKTFAEYGFLPEGWIAAGLLAVSTAMQIAVIKAQKFASGGRVFGGVRIAPDSRGDDTLIMAKQGEVVLNQSQQQRLGGPIAMRRVGIPGFASGGLVGGGDISYSPGFGFDAKELAEMIAKAVNDKQVILDINKVNSAQSELGLINKTQRI